jgi:hypothetical protein
MGENRASEGSIQCGFVGEDASCVKDDHLSITQNTAYLQSFYVDNLKYTHGKAFEYNKCNFNYVLEVALMIKSMTGVKKYDY